MIMFRFILQKKETVKWKSCETVNINKKQKIQQKVQKCLEGWVEKSEV